LKFAVHPFFSDRIAIIITATITITTKNHPTFSQIFWISVELCWLLKGKRLHFLHVRRTFFAQTKSVKK